MSTDITASDSHKRKADDADLVDPSVDRSSATAAASIFYEIPDSVWDGVAGFAVPPDVYNLALSSKRFHEREEEKEQQPQSVKEDEGKEEEKMVVLATKMLRSSLLSSLARVLRASKSGITIGAALELSKLATGSVVLAGSTLVQTCLGTLWGSADVDVYCTAPGAPAVRSWLVESANCMFGGFEDYLISVEDARLAYSVDTSIHHVESWGKIPEDMIGPNENPEQWYSKRCEYGRGVQRNYVDFKYDFLTFAGIEDIGPDNDIKPLDGHELPFDFDCVDPSIDLIVAKMQCTNAFELLDDFDLNCKASFDGTKFGIPDPHLTFAGKSDMEPLRKALVATYVAHYDEKNPFHQSRLDSAFAAIHCVSQKHPGLPFFRNLDRIDDLPESRSLYANTEIEITMQFHNFVTTLVDRLKKYQRRGIRTLRGECEIAGTGSHGFVEQSPRRRLVWHRGRKG